ncbi:MAG TPA: hypothetical protein VJH37_02110 [Candidatus Nanoarchaeia archaeon]|nr:hypothetical protein [Candidatus Nanoarchaeia archaeon]
MLTLVLLMIVFLFFLFTFFKRTLQKLLPFSFCALCASVFLTWTGLFILSFFAVPLDTTLLGILMGESITGLMYKLTLRQQLQSKNPVLSLLLILLGTSIAYFVLTKNFIVSSLYVLVPIFFFALLLSLPKKKNLSLKTQHLREKLEHCCS